MKTTTEKMGTVCSGVHGKRPWKLPSSQTLEDGGGKGMVQPHGYE